MKETLERYIKFAIDNGFDGITEEKLKLVYPRQHKKKGKIVYCSNYIYISYVGSITGSIMRVPILEIITRKEFGKSIIKGINAKGVKNISPIYSITESEFVLSQSLAIYNGTLETFVNNLLPKTEQGEK